MPAVMANPITKWRKQHLHPVSFWLHMAGIPACFLAAPVMLVLHLWWWAAALFIGGYIFQFVGHAIEGNRSGEELLLRRLLGGKNARSGQDRSG